MRSAYRDRWGKTSSGIQLTPLTVIGSSLMTKVNPVPASSRDWSRRTVRKPTRPRHGVEHLVGGPQQYGHVVEGLLAPAARPPPAYLRDAHLDRAGVGVDGDRTAHPAGLDLHREVAGVSGPLDGHMRHEHSGVTLHSGHRPDRREPGRAPGVQPDGAPDAGAGEVGTPVPAEAAGRLADRVVRVVDHVRAGAQDQAHGVGVPDRRRERHRESVGARPQAVAHVDAVCAVHVGRRGHRLAVQLDSRHGVQALEDEVYSVVGAGRPVDDRLVPPVGQPDPGQATLVVVQVGIGDEAGGEQVGVHRPGHRGRNRAGRHDLVRHRTPGRTESPVLVQRQDVHVIDPLV
jgi:hypothetical protein